MDLAWRAVEELEDYFARLGGAGRFPGFRDYMMPGVVLVLLIEQVAGDGPNAYLRGVISRRMWNNRDGVIESAMGTIAKINESSKDLIEDFISDATRWVDQYFPEDRQAWNWLIEESRERMPY